MKNVSVTDEERLGKEARELSSGASALKVKEDDEHGEAEGDDGRPKVNVSTEDGVELDATEPREDRELSEAGGEQLRDCDGLPGAKGGVAEEKHPTGDEAELTAECTLNVLDDAARDGDSRRELTENHTNRNEKNSAEPERDHCGNGSAAEHHPIAYQQHPTGADDCAKADGEEVEERKLLLHPSGAGLLFCHTKSPFIRNGTSCCI